MAIVDGLVVMTALSILLVGLVAYRKVRRKTDPEFAGSENAEKAKQTAMRRCQFCKKDTSPDVDLYVDKRWYHIACYSNKDNEK